MQVIPTHKIEERGDHRMVYKSAIRGHAYIVAERQHPAGLWNISCVSDNIHHPEPDVTTLTRSAAIDEMCQMALRVLEEYKEDGSQITAYDCWIPYWKQQDDGTRVKLHDKP